MNTTGLFIKLPYQISVMAQLLNKFHRSTAFIELFQILKIDFVHRVL